MADEELIAYSILGPHFDAVRDTFARFSPTKGWVLDRLHAVKLVVTREAYAAPRNYARCREDGRLIELAPQAADVEHETLVAILSHEMGHAADFAYPGCWVLLGDSPSERRAVWIGERDDKPARRYRRLWHERNKDQIEWSADAIAEKVTGLKVRYCGDCMLQCFTGSAVRPAALR